MRLRLYVNGEQLAAPRTFVSWEGYKLNVFAPRRQRLDGSEWIFAYWSDRREYAHTITTPAEPRTYTATFRRAR